MIPEGAEAHDDVLPEGAEAHDDVLPEEAEAHDDVLPEGAEAHDDVLPEGAEAHDARPEEEEEGARDDGVLQEAEEGEEGGCHDTEAAWGHCNDAAEDRACTEADLPEDH